MTRPEKGPCTGNPLCIQGKQNEPVLSNIRKGLIDPDTPLEAMTRISATGKKQKLVFSDEFNVDGRTFYDGDDPYFQAVDIWYGATQDLEVSRAPAPTQQFLTHHSGTIPMRRGRKTAPSFSSSLDMITMDSSTALAWYNPGISFATRVAISRPVSPYPERAM